MQQDRDIGRPRVVVKLNYEKNMNMKQFITHICVDIHIMYYSDIDPTNLIRNVNLHMKCSLSA